MPDTIRDGKGRGYLVEIDRKNRIRGYVVIEQEAMFINRIEGEMYSALWGSSGSGITAATADNVVLYLKNTSEKDIVIVKVKHRCVSADGTMSFWLGMTGTPGGSLTTLTPSNRNAGSNNVANCTYYRSDNITGMSGGRQVGSIFGKDGEKFEYAEPCSGWILPPNGVFTAKVNNNTSEHKGGISFYFRDTGV
jgi:hypothetical protein